MGSNEEFYKIKDNFVFFMLFMKYYYRNENYTDHDCLFDDLVAGCYLLEVAWYCVKIKERGL